MAPAPVASGGLQAQIEELQRSLQPMAKPKVAQAPNEQAPAEPTGLVGLVEHLLDLRAKVTTIDQRLDANETFAKSVAATHAPLEKELPQVDNSAQQLSQQSLGDDRATIEQRKNDFENLLNQRKMLGTALLPVTKQEVMLRATSTISGNGAAQVLRTAAAVLHTLVLRLSGSCW